MRFCSCGRRPRKGALQCRRCLKCRPSAEPEPAVRVSQIADDDPRSPEKITLDSIQQMVGFLDNLRYEIEGHIDELNSGLSTNVHTTDEIILWE